MRTYLCGAVAFVILAMAVGSVAAYPTEHDPVYGSRRTPAGAGQVLDYDPAHYHDVWIYDVEYRRAGNESWFVRIYEPQGPGPFPLLLDVHGGVWSQLDRTLDALVDHALAASGVVVAAIDFRQAPQHPYPASIADVNYATRWLKVHARDFKADPRIIGGLGMSSGGHLVMLSAMRPRDARYAALLPAAPPNVDAVLGYVICLHPILDPYARYLFAQQTGRADLVRGHDDYFQTAQAMQEGNPQLILARGERVNLPPVLVLQGTADRNVTLEMQERFAAAYRAAGGSIDLVTFPGAQHGFTLSAGPETERAIALVKAFIAARMTHE